MPEFLELLPPDEARETFLKYIHPLERVEVIHSADADGRVISQAVKATEPSPPFSRSSVDGFAVRARDTYGASDTLPMYLKLTGEIPMGASAGIAVGAGECVLIHTGGMLPDGADAVVMVENTQSAQSHALYGSADEIEVMRAVAVGENIIKVGEDVTVGETVIPAGRRLRAVEIGGLMALGVTRVSVIDRPRVGIISSGDEIVPPDRQVIPGQIRDVNAYTLSALVERAGGAPVRLGIANDRYEVMKKLAAQALDECDMVVITAGSSASARDLTSQVVQSLGEPGILVHGLNIRPGKPTILAVCNGKPVVGLPGNPVSAFVVAWLFCVPALQKMSGYGEITRQKLPARLSLNLSSQAGREDWIPVRLAPSVAPGENTPLAEPVFGKSNLIFTLARADGLIRIPPPANGLAAGEIVEVFLI